jgi:thiol-disulfide isomerase/thioredoxin
MKQNVQKLLVLFALISFGCNSAQNVSAQEKDKQDNPYAKFSDQSTWVLGYFKRSQITSTPHSEWFTKGYDEYQLNTEALNSLHDISKDGVSVKIVMGTWCPDSRKQVPRFLRIMDIWNFPESSVTFIGVDDAKQSPVGEYEKLDIQRVPTFIFYKNNIEAGRIIENPVTSLEQDMVNILTSKEQK